MKYSFKKKPNVRKDEKKLAYSRRLVKSKLIQSPQKTFGSVC